MERTESSAAGNSPKKEDSTVKNDKTATARHPASAPPEIQSITVKGQRYSAPSGRHSQQTHRLAEERALAQGNANEKERSVKQEPRTANQKPVVQSVAQEEAK